MDRVVTCKTCCGQGRVPALTVDKWTGNALRCKATCPRCMGSGYMWEESTKGATKACAEAYAAIRRAQLGVSHGA